MIANQTKVYCSRASARLPGRLDRARELPVLATALLTWIVGCGSLEPKNDCPDVLCTSGDWNHVDILEPQRLLPGGTYVIEVDTDVESATITCVVPSMEVQDVCESSAKGIQGALKNLSSGSSITIVFDERLSMATIRVFKDGNGVAQGTFTAKYDTVSSNPCPPCTEVVVTPKPTIILT